MTNDGDSLWAAICATVTPLGKPGGKRKRAVKETPAPQSVIDLHDLTVDTAYRAVREFLELPHQTTTVTVITGKSGIIRKEFPSWMKNWGYVATEKNGGGAFTVRVL